MKYVCIQLFILLVIVISTEAQTDDRQITASTITNLEQLHTFDGHCASFQPDGIFFATTRGLFNLDSGEQVIEVADTRDVSRILPGFSPDGRWLVIGETIVDVQSGEVAHQFDSPIRQRFMFSDNGLYAHSNGNAFSLPNWDSIESSSLPDYEIFRDITRLEEFETITRIGRDFKIGNGIPRYISTDETYWVVVTGGLSDHIEQGIYDISTGERLDLPVEFEDPFEAANLLEMGTFIPGDSLFFAHDNGTDIYTGYHLPSFEQAYTLPFDIGDENRLYVSFSENTLYFGVRDDGIYQTLTGERLFEIDGNPVFSPDDNWVATSESLYQLPTGQQVNNFSEGARIADFSENGELLAVIPDGVFDLFIGEERFDIAEDTEQAFFNVDSSLLITLRREQVISMYDTTSGEEVATLMGHSLMMNFREHYIALNVDDSCHIYGIR